MNFMTADVEIKVDGSKLPAQLAKAKTLVVKTVSTIKNSFSKIATSFKAAFDKMVRIAKWGALAIAGALTLATRAAMKQQDAVFLLTAALKIAGEWTQTIENRFRAFAASIQKATIYGDEEVLALMQLQKSLGVTADKLELAAKQAIGLATATGRDIRSMAMYIALAQQGEFTMLRRYIPALRATTDETEQLEIITRVCAEGFKLAEERAKTTSGGLKQMWNALGDVSEKIGGALLPAITDSAKAIKEWAKNNEDAIGRWAETTVAYITYAKDVFIEFLKFMRSDFGAGIKLGLDVGIILLKGFGKSIVIILEFAAVKAADAFITVFGDTIAAQFEKLAEKLKYYKPLEAWGLRGIAKRIKEAKEPTAIAPVEPRLKQVLGQTRDELMGMTPPKLLVGVDAASERLIISLKSIGQTAKEQQEPMEEAFVGTLQKAKEVAKEVTEELGRVQADMAAGMARSFSEAIDKMIFESKRLSDALKDMGRAILRMITEIVMYESLARPLAEFITGKEGKPGFAQVALGAVAGGIGSLFGPGAGTVGAEMSAQAKPGYYESAQHGGYVEKTGWAKIHKGETYSGVNGSYGKSTVNVYNTISDRVEVEVEEYMQSDQRIIDVSMKAAGTDSLYRRSIRGVH